MRDESFFIPGQGAKLSTGIVLRHAGILCFCAQVLCKLTAIQASIVHGFLTSE